MTDDDGIPMTGIIAAMEREGIERTIRRLQDMEREIDSAVTFMRLLRQDAAAVRRARFTVIDGGKSEE